MSATNLNIRTDKDVKEQAVLIYTLMYLMKPLLLPSKREKSCLMILLPLNIPVWKNSRQHWNHEIRCKIYLSVQERFEACQKAEQKYR